MMTTFNLTTEVPSNRKVRITLPDTVPTGPVEMTIVVTPRGGTDTRRTLRELRQSEFFGLWRDRSDIEDSAAFARRLRVDAWSRTS